MYPKESLWQNFEGYFRKPYFWQKWPKTAHIDPNSPRSPGWPEVVKQFESPNIALEILMGTSSGFDLTSSVSTLLAKENSLFKQSCLQQWLVNYITGGAVKHNLDKGLLRMSVHVGWEARDRKEGQWVQDDPVKAPADTNRLSRPALLSAPG